MTAELGEDSLASFLQTELVGLLHPLIHGIAFDASSGTLDPLLSVAEHEGGTIIALLDPSRNDTAEAFVQIGKIDHQHPVIFHMFRRDHFHGATRSLFRQRLPLLVEADQLGCQRRRLPLIFFH